MLTGKDELFFWAFVIGVAVIVALIYTIFKKLFDKLDDTHGIWAKKIPSFYAFGISWIFAFTLGCVLAGWPSAAIQEKDAKYLSINLILAMMLLPPVGLVVSTIAAILISPLARWSSRTGKRNLVIYGSLLWLVIALFIVSVQLKFKELEPFGFWGPIILGVVGLIVIGRIPPQKSFKG